MTSTLDHRIARRHFGQSAPGYLAAAALQREVEARLLERLDFIGEIEGLVLDAGCGPGRAATALQKKYRKARIVALDFARPMLDEIRCGWRRPIWPVCGDIRRLPLAAGSVDLVFSNLALQWCEPLNQTFRELIRVLKPGAPMVFTTFGVETLHELRQAWAEVDPDHTHVHSFRDMAEIGDLLLSLGCVNPVIDVDTFTLKHQDVRGLMRELKAIGAQNASTNRPRGLTPPARIRALAQAYAPYSDGQHLPSTWQVVYGYALAPAHATRVDEPGQVAAFPIEKLKGSRVKRER